MSDDTEWKVEQGHTGWVVWRGSWAFGEKFTISKDALNGLHQANKLQELLTGRAALEADLTSERAENMDLAKKLVAESDERAALEARLALVEADAERLARNTRWFLSRPQSLDSGGLSPSMRERIEGALANHEALNSTKAG